MNTYIFNSTNKSINDRPFEVVETKGLGHPDNISDSLAEQISNDYSIYCMNKYGIVLRHMVDKLTVIGGSSKVQFGSGYMTKPIKVLLNGRFTDSFENEQINYYEIASKTIKNYFQKLFPLLDVDSYLSIIDNTHKSEGPGVVYNSDGSTNNERENFFSVNNEKNKHDHLNKLRTNDTSTTVSYFPLSTLEKTVLAIEGTLNSDETKNTYPHIGNDIKVMGVRTENKIEITACVPLIAKFVKSESDYFKKLNEIEKIILNISNANFPNSEIKIFLNTRDNPETNDFYLTAIGSAIESGDEGAVGRGNRSNGTISFTRNMSLEAACGKNPIYHTGKLYSAIGNEISKEIYNTFGIENTIYLTSKMGGKISEPWNVAVELYGNNDVNFSKDRIENIVTDTLNNHFKISEKIIYGKIKLNNY